MPQPDQRWKGVRIWRWWICKTISLETWRLIGWDSLFWEAKVREEGVSTLLLLLFSHPVVSNSLGPRGLQHTRPPCPSPSPGVCSSSCSLHWLCCPAISSSDALLYFCPRSFPASGTFPMIQVFTSDDHNTGASASASFLPVSIQGWAPLRVTGLILLSNRLSGVFSSTTVLRHLFFGTQLSL